MTNGRWKSPLQRAIVEWLAAHPETTRSGLAEKAGIAKSIVTKLANGEQLDAADLTLDALAAAMGTTSAILRDGGEGVARVFTPGTIEAAGRLDGDGPQLALLSYVQLSEGISNPRGSDSAGFEGASIAELAESIWTEGLLQNLVVLPADRVTGKHALIAGHRRYRAIGRLVDDGRWDPEARLIPCRIVAGGVDRTRAIALLENLQRVDLTPLEEAEALDALTLLDPERYTVQFLAEHVVHKTTRFVQQRLAIARKLSKKAKKLLVENRITVDAARLLATAPKAQQDELALRIVEDRVFYADKAEGEPYSAGDLVDDVRDGWIDAAHAIFPTEAHAASIVEDDDGKRWFTNGEAFWTEQEAAAKAKADELRRERAWVRLIDGRKSGQWFHESHHIKSRAKDLSKAGAVVFIKPDGTVTVHDGLLQKQSDAGSGTSQAERSKTTPKGAAAPPPSPPFTKAHLVAAHEWQTTALQNAVLAHSVADGGATAMRLVCLALLEHADVVHIDRKDPANTMRRLRGLDVQAVLVPAVEALPAASGTRFAAIREIGDAPRGERPSEDDDTHAAGGINVRYGAPGAVPPGYDTSGPGIWKMLCDLDLPQLVRLFSALVADRCYLAPGYDPKPWHPPLAVAIAETVGLDMRAHWRPDEAWFASSKRVRLQAMADAIGDVPKAKTAKALAASLKEVFEANREGPPAAWFPPEMEVLDEATFRQRLAATPAASPEAGHGAADGEGDEAGATA